MLEFCFSRIAPLNIGTHQNQGAGTCVVRLSVVHLAPRLQGTCRARRLGRRPAAAAHVAPRPTRSTTWTATTAAGTGGTAGTGETTTGPSGGVTAETGTGSTSGGSGTGITTAAAT